MSKKKKRNNRNNNKNHSYNKSQSYYDSLFQYANPKDVRDIAIKVFGSTYFTLSSDQ
jgi:hypothetical protein